MVENGGAEVVGALPSSTRTHSTVRTPLVIGGTTQGTGVINAPRGKKALRPTLRLRLLHHVLHVCSQAEGIVSRFDSGELGWSPQERLEKVGRRFFHRVLREAVDDAHHVDLWVAFGVAAPHPHGPLRAVPPTQAQLALWPGHAQTWDRSNKHTVVHQPVTLQEVHVHLQLPKEVSSCRMRHIELPGDLVVFGHSQIWEFAKLASLWLTPLEVVDLRDRGPGGMVQRVHEHDSPYGLGQRVAEEAQDPHQQRRRVLPQMMVIVLQETAVLP
mmetsp:Transcript_7149/g.12640  ORF Transcript_7149/g.12640 Transcript_7149/m.12640 type:complete len:271 (-) Transcript_7149:2091-2903(-)